MILYFLIIPIFLYTLIQFILYLFRNTPYTLSERGQQNHFDLISSVLMTATRSDRAVRCRVKGKAGRLDIEFSDSGATLNFIKSDRIDEDRMVQLYSELKSADIRNIDWKPNTKELSMTVSGNPAEIAATVRKAFRMYFAVGPRRAVEFSIDAHMNDEKLLRKVWTSFAQLDELPVAETSGDGLIKLKDGEARAKQVTFSVLIAPIPFLIAYDIWGFKIAIWVFLISSTLMLGRSLQLRDRTQKLKRMTYLMMVTPLLCALSIWNDDFIYVLIIPSVQCLFWFVTLIINSVTGNGVFDNAPYKPTTKIIMSCIGLLILAFGVFTNEYLRQTENMDLWVWYFAYLRLELFVGFLFAILPITIALELDNKGTDTD